MNFDTTCVSSRKETPDLIEVDSLDGVQYDEDEQNELIIHFDVENKFNRYDVNNKKVEKRLQLMYYSMGANFEKRKTWCSSMILRKIKPLNQRWLKATK